MKSVRLSFLALALMAAACGDDAESNAASTVPPDHESGPVGDESPDSSADESESQPESPSAAQVFEVFQTECAICHVATKLGDLQYDSPASMHAAFVNELAKNPLCTDKDRVLVSPGDPDNSLLVQKLEGTQDCGTRMPAHLEMPAETIALVRAWIDAGAPLN